MRKRSFWAALVLSLLLTLTYGWGPFSTLASRTVAQTVAQTVASDSPSSASESSPASPETSEDPKTADADGDGETDFETTVEPLERLEGMLTLYQDKKKEKLLAEIRPEQFNRYYLMVTTLSQGIGEFGLFRGRNLQDFPFTFRKVNNRIEVVVPNLFFRTTREDPQRNRLRESFSDSVLYSLPIVATQAETQHVLVDLSTLILKQPVGLNAIAPSLQFLGYIPNLDQSYLQQVKNLEQNIELDAIYNFAGGREGGLFRLFSVPSDALSLGIHYSLSELPQNNGYRPRIADERVGYFLTAFRNIANRERRDPSVRYIHRWFVEKQDPTAELSPPKEPIVLWIENAVPMEYRDAFREGALMWNRAFEKIGIKDAIEVRQMPDDADWDPADVRYNTIRWFEGLNSTFALGPSRVNPFTGQILDADIVVGSGIVRFEAEQFDILVNGANQRSAFPADHPTAELSELGALGLGTALDCLTPHNPALSAAITRANQEVASAASSSARAPGLHSGLSPNLQPDRHPHSGHSHDESHQCFASRFNQQVAYGSMALSSLNQVLPSSDEAQEFLHQSLSHLIAHEVGHILGLRHNFQGSDWLMPEELHDTAITEAKGLVASVMDYVPVNLAPPGVEQGEYFPHRIGPYDEWAIEYGYKPLSPVKGSVASERRELEAIASRAAEPGLAYGPDEDVVGLDPRVRPFDLSRDPLAYNPVQLKQVRQLWEKINLRGPGQGESYSELRREFQVLMGYYLSNLWPLTDYVGGRQFNRYRAGDAPGQVPLDDVPLEQQQQALELLAQYAFNAQALTPPAELLNKLPTSRWRRSRQLDYPLYEQVSSFQTLLLSDLLSSDRLARLRDAELRSSKPTLTLAELFQTLHESIWSPSTQEEHRLSALQRGLQRQHLTILSNMTLRNLQAPQEAATFAQLISAFLTLDAPEDARALARLQLQEIHREMEQLGRRSRDRTTRAHCQDIEHRIDQVLSATRIGS